MPESKIRRSRPDGQKIIPRLRRFFRARANSEWRFGGGARSLTGRFLPLQQIATRTPFEIDAQFWMRSPYEELTFEFVGPEASKALREKLADGFRQFILAQSVPEEVQASRGSTVVRVKLRSESIPPRALIPRAHMFFDVINGSLRSWSKTQMPKIVFDARKRPPSGTAWSRNELEAAVNAYMAMLHRERTRQPINKSAVNQELRDGPLAGRSRGSIEFRMANISAVLQSRNRPWIRGYRPRGNVGAEVASVLLTLLRLHRTRLTPELAPESDEKKLREKVRRIRKRKVAVIAPIGQAHPGKISKPQVAYERDPQVRAWVLEHAAGHCELCRNPAPFKDLDDFPFLEVHHVRPLARGGSDTTSNAVAVCPNCHRLCHDGKDREQAKESLYKYVHRLVRE